MKLPIIQSVWVGNPLSRLEQLCVKSFLDHGHEFHLYTYDEVGNIPLGATIKDANKIVPRDEIFTYKGGSFAGFGNLFRYALLSKKGNFWVDMNVVCIKPLAFDEKIVFAASIDSGYECSVLAFPKGHALCEQLEQACRHHNWDFPWDDLADKKRKRKARWLKQRKEKTAFGKIGGPVVFSKAVDYYKLQSHAKPFMYFYPLHYPIGEHYFTDKFHEGIRLYHDTHAVHLWNEHIRRTPGFDKNARFDKHSLFEQLAKKHGIEPAPNAPRIKSAELIALVKAHNSEGAKRKRRQRKILLALALAVVFGMVAGQYLVGFSGFE